MNLHEWLDAQEGRAVALASKLGLSKGAVSLWRLQGVPMVHMRAIERLTDGEVSVDHMLRHALECKTRGQAGEPTATPEAA